MRRVVILGMCHIAMFSIGSAMTIVMGSRHKGLGFFNGRRRRDKPNAYPQ
jgi:hypothetical protein